MLCLFYFEVCYNKKYALWQLSEMKYREKKDGEVEHSKEQNAASDIRFGMANYAGTADANCGAVYGHWNGQCSGNKSYCCCGGYKYSKLADWKYDFCDQHRISGIHIPVNRSRKKRTGKKSFRTGCADSCDRRNIFYNSDNGTEP